MNFLKGSVGIDEETLLRELREIASLPGETVSELARLSILYLRNPSLKPSNFMEKLNPSISHSYARTFLLMLKLSSTAKASPDVLAEDLTILGFS
jgi:hypothetical protein